MRDRQSLPEREAGWLFVDNLSRLEVLIYDMDTASHSNGIPFSKYHSHSYIKTYILSAGTFLPARTVSKMILHLLQIATGNDDSSPTYAAHRTTA